MQRIFHLAFCCVSPGSILSSVSVFCIVVCLSKCIFSEKVISILDTFNNVSSSQVARGWCGDGDVSSDAKNPEERGEVGIVVIVVRTRNVQIFKRYILSCRNCPHRR